MESSSKDLAVSVTMCCCHISGLAKANKGNCRDKEKP